MTTFDEQGTVEISTTGHILYENSNAGWYDINIFPQGGAGSDSFEVYIQIKNPVDATFSQVVTIPVNATSTNNWTETAFMIKNHFAVHIKIIASKISGNTRDFDFHARRTY